MKRVGAVFDKLSQSVWIKRLLAAAAILGALVVLIDFPGKLSKTWEAVFSHDSLSIAHLQEFSGLARVERYGSGQGRSNRMVWPMAFSILNPTSDIITVEDFSIRLPTAMVDQDGTPLWIETPAALRRSIDIATTIPALQALVTGQTDADLGQRQTLPVALSGGEKIYVSHEVWFDLPPGFGFETCAPEADCDRLLIRALGSEIVPDKGWRCPNVPSEMSLRTRDHGTSRFTEATLVLIEGCVLFTP